MYGAKAEAARILDHAGWRVERISAALAASTEHVRDWLDGKQPRIQAPRTATHCESCGATENLRNNGLCLECTRLRWQVIRDRVEMGDSRREIAEDLGISHVTIIHALEQTDEDQRRPIFSERTQEQRRSRVKDAIVAAGSRGMTRTDISKLLGGHVSADHLDALLESLVTSGAIHSSSLSTRGRPKIVYSVS